ncbi:hypothetical protein [Falsiroseomonas selenitidurans]|uniref:Diguanylate cyclase n=1 Tax=Falsiroseomonas selenitidurans TaxID=2716335 RepID=A0ABX1EF13_9PROT|nr:hypothetical protein [Falsiroseomonas selenitidurans]NKC34313.1 hypothetical protein [Falsiroseomonas selenitidurans]
MEIVDNRDEQERLFASLRRRTEAYRRIQRVNAQVAEIVLELCRNHCRNAFVNRSTQHAVIYCASASRYSHDLDPKEAMALDRLHRSLRLRGIRLSAAYVTDDGEPYTELTASNPTCERLLRERFGRFFRTNVRLDYNEPDYFQAFSFIDGHAQQADAGDLEHFSAVLAVAWKPVISGDVLEAADDDRWR